MPAPIGLGTYDLFLAYGGDKYGLLLERDAQGRAAWFPGLAPDLQPQFTTGDYGYDSTPSRIDIPLAFQDFSWGAGFTDAPRDTPNVTQRGYSFSRGIDASEGDRLYKSPAQVDTSGVAAGDDPEKYYHSSVGGLLLIAGDAIYKWVTSAWVSQKALGGNAIDIIDFEGNVYVSATGEAYWYSSDGASWTQSTLSSGTPRPAYWATRDDNLWYVSALSTVATSSNPINGGTAWTAEDGVGHSAESVRGLLEIDGDLYIYKEEGIYRYTGLATEDVWLGGATYRRTTNGFMPYIWVDGNSYVPYQDRLLRFRHGDAQLDFVFPTLAMRGNPEVNGQITAIGGDSRWLYVAIFNAAGNTYIMRGNPYRRDGEGEWHTYLYLGSNTCEAILVTGPTSDGPSSTNPVLHYQYGSADTRHVILARPGLRPEDDANYNFDTTTGKLVTAYQGFGTRSFPKFLNAGRIVGGNLSSTETIRLDYEIDSSGSEVQILIANTTGSTKQNITNEVAFNRIRGILKMETGSTTETPIGHAFVLHATPNPPRRHAWNFVVKVADRLDMLGGGLSRYAGRDLEAFLFGAIDKRVTLSDADGRSFIVKVSDVQGIGSEDDLSVQMATSEIGALN